MRNADYAAISRYRSKLDQSQGQKNRHIRAGNSLLIQLSQEFGYEQFSRENVFDSFGAYAADRSNTNECLAATFENLLHHNFVVGNSEGGFEISEEGHTLVESLETDEEEVYQ